MPSKNQSTFDASTRFLLAAWPSARKQSLRTVLPAECRLPHLLRSAAGKDEKTGRHHEWGSVVEFRPTQSSARIRGLRTGLRRDRASGAPSTGGAGSNPTSPHLEFRRHAPAFSQPLRWPLRGLSRSAVGATPFQSPTRSLRLQAEGWVEDRECGEPSAWRATRPSLRFWLQDRKSAADSATINPP
jgi:hypothetical protein